MPNQQQRAIESWLEPVMLELQRNDVVTVLASPRDENATALIAKGSIGIPLLALSRKAAMAHAALCFDVDPLQVAATKMRAFGILNVRREDRGLVFYLRGAYWVPDRKQIALLVAVDKHAAPAVDVPDSIRHEIARRRAGYADAVNAWEAEEAAAKAAEEQQFSSCPELLDTLRKTQAIKGYYVRPRPPFPEMQDLLSQLPQVVWSANGSRKSIRGGITSSVLPAASEPEHEILYALNADKGHNALVSWNAPDALPTFSEVKSALQRVLPSAFAKPLARSVNPPDENIRVETVQSVSFEDDWPIGHMSEASIDERDFRERAERGKRFIRDRGFEAIGWYQSFHSYAEGYWGIYLHGERMADLACGLGSDIANRLRMRQQPAHALALELVLRHEWFHFIADASMSLLELEARSARYRRYSSNVYQQVVLTDDCLEEALANWYARREVEALIRSGVVSDRAPSSASAEGTVLAVLEDWLDFSPPGYRVWRRGNDRRTWKMFGTQALWATRSGAVGEKVAPFGTAILEPARLTLRKRHVPVRMVEPGPYAGVTPFALNRRAAVALLKHFQYRVIPNRGKGSHEFWRGPNGDGFPLPQRDPLSMRVFRNLIDHLGITKERYLREFHGMV